MHALLKQNSAGTSTVSLDHFFSSLSQYYTNLGQFSGSTPARPDITIDRSDAGTFRRKWTFRDISY